METLHNHKKTEDYFVHFPANGLRSKIDDANVYIFSELTINSGVYTLLCVAVCSNVRTTPLSKSTLLAYASTRNHVKLLFLSVVFDPKSKKKRIQFPLNFNYISEVYMKKQLFAILLVALFPVSALASTITTQEVEAAQIAWGNGIVEIGKSKNPRKAAIAHIDEFYGFDIGSVLFKPTLASVDQFRGTKKEALSYFIGQDLKEDKGFALAPYTKVRWENEGIITDGDSALAMGNYFFTGKDGKEVKVEYSFGYVKDENGQLKINLHHSSLPFSPK